MGQGFIKKNGGSPTEYEQMVNYTMLYHRGDECADITGGWNAHLKFNYTQENGYATKEASYLDFGDKSEDVYGNGGFYTAKAIDLTEYTGFYADLELYKSGSHRNLYFPSIALAVTRSVPPYLWSDDTGVNSISCEQVLGTDSESYVGRKVASLSVSDINRSGYLCVAQQCYAYWTVTGQSRCYSAWLTKNDDWSELAYIAGVSASSISVMLTDSKKLLANKRAVSFMVARCTGEFMSNAIRNDTFMTELADSPYKEMVYANEHWAKFLAMVA